MYSTSVTPHYTLDMWHYQLLWCLKLYPIKSLASKESMRSWKLRLNLPSFYSFTELTTTFLPKIICIAQTTCEFVYYTLPVYQRRLYVKKKNESPVGPLGIHPLHLHQCVGEHKHSVIGKDFRDEYGSTPKLLRTFKSSKKWRSKLEWLIFKMLGVKNKLSTQADPICAKRFACHLC